jgi:tetratricopeptide (TPR) repeat protein
MRRPASRPAATSWRLWLAAALVTAATAVVFAPVATHGFVGIDDPDYVANNTHVTRGVTWPGVVWALTTTHAANWHPVTWLSHMLDVELFGLDAGAHHLVNVAIHGANAVLILLLLHAFTGAVVRSAFVAALFALHPLHVESVAWVSERKDVLSTLFLLLTIGAYWRAERTSSSRWLMIALGVYALGLMSKPMLVTLPVLLVLGGRVFHCGKRADPARNGVVDRWRPVPFLALALASGVVTVIAQASGGAVRDLERYPIGLRAANAVITAVEYLARMIWPAQLSPFYPYPAALPVATVVGCVALLAAITWLASRARRRAPYLSAGWAWYLVTLAPVIGIVQVGNQASADRYTYVPLIGIFVAIVWGAAHLARTAAVRRVALAAGVAIVIAYASAARAQVRVWRDDVALWTRAVDATRQTDNHSAHFALGVALRQRGDVDGAIANFRRAVELQSSFVAARYQLGIALLSQHRATEAIPHLESVVTLDANHPTAQQAAGEAYMRVGRPSEALRHFAALVSREPRRADYRYQLGLVFLALGQSPDAAAQLDEAIRLDPTHEGARRARAGIR